MSEVQSPQHKPKFSWITIPVILLFVVVIPLSVYCAGKFIDGLFHFPIIPLFPWNWILGPLTIGTGLGLAWGSIYQLYRQGLGLPWGPVNKEAESTQLITTGLYAYTRNPMILGFLIFLSGIGWLFQSLTAIIVIPGIVFVLLYIWLISKEEPNLEQRFGADYRIYKQTTPRIFPRPWRRRIKKTRVPADIT
jgi:protein-S-isoprenylcysteine O-methyltransferase Ste14